MRMLAVLLLFVALLISRASLAVMGLLMLTAMLLALLARGLVKLRWPALPRYVRVAAADLPPKHWQPNQTGSPSFVAWAAARPALERWCAAHQRGLYRGLARSSRGGSAASVARDFARHSLSDYVAVCDALAARLTAAELATVRSTGVLPMWFWAALAGASAPPELAEK
jgi:hypothetical protein